MSWHRTAVPTGFWAYPSAPREIGESIEAAARLLNKQGKVNISTWRQMDIPGRFIVEGIMEKIEQADFVVADITRLNFNVTFEIGYGIGVGKRMVLTLNPAYTPDLKLISKLGMFDTLGYSECVNAAEYAEAVSRASIDPAPLRLPSIAQDRTTAIYYLDTRDKTDASVRIKARIKKARIQFRSYDPAEESRLSAVDALQNVNSSVAVVLHLLSANFTEAMDNNLRAAFLAGLAHGRKKEILLLQAGDDPVPLDYRDLVDGYTSLDQIDRHINDLAPKVMERLQARSGSPAVPRAGVLASLDMGAAAAENEFMNLGEYYLPTPQYTDSLSGKIRIVTGRKGTGKSALFFQIRDKVRANRQNIVLDLKPEGHQLKRFKEMVVEWLTDASQEHVAAAFWEYVLLLELAHKLLYKDREVHVRNHRLFEPYRDLEREYRQDRFITEGDFSERMLALVTRISDDFREQGRADGSTDLLRSRDVTEFLHVHDIRTLRDRLVAYLELKNEVWLLFDNVDRSWPTRGVGDADILLLRGLLDATRSIERMLRSRGVPTTTMVFLRSDVFEFLVDRTPDRGKESRVSTDWHDPDLLKEVIRLRIGDSVGKKNRDLDSLWSTVSVSHINGEHSLDYLVERSLMRPRNLINLVSYCRNSAVSLGHARIEATDIDKAVHQYSADVVQDIGFELRDVAPEAEEVLYAFIGTPAVQTLEDVRQRLRSAGVGAESVDGLVEALMWYGFLGVVRVDESGEEVGVYIHSVYYEVRKLKHLAKRFREPGVRLVIHKAFRPFLEVG